MERKHLLNLFKISILLFGLLLSCTLGGRYYYIYDYEHGCGCWHEVLEGKDYGSVLEGWYAETVDSEDDVGMYSSIYVDSNDTIHIGYYEHVVSYYGYGSGSKDGGDEYESHYYAKYAKKLAGRWIKYRVSYAGESIGDLDIAVDSKGNAHLSFSARDYEDDYYDDDCDFNHPPELLATHYLVGEQELSPPVTISPAESAELGIYFEYADEDCNLEGGHFYVRSTEPEETDWYDLGVLPEGLGCSTEDSGFSYGFLFSSNPLDPDHYAGETKWTDYCADESNIMPWEFTVADDDIDDDTDDDADDDADDDIDDDADDDTDDDGYIFDAVFYATNKANSWLPLLLEDEVGDAHYTSIAVDSDDNVHIAYYSNNALKYAQNSSGSWEVFTIDASTEEVESWGGFTAIATDSNDNVHISYCVYSKGLRYATNVSSEWKVHEIDSQPAVGQYNDIAIDSNGKVHISYYDDDKEALKYATNASGKWKRYVIDHDAGLYTSIAIDSGDFIHISYYDPDAEALKYATNKSGSWQTYTIDTRGDTGLYTSIAVDSEDFVHISYFNNTGDNLIYVTNRKPE